MKHLFLPFLFLVACLPARAQTPHPTVANVANMIAKGMCECFNENAAPKLTPATRNALEKLAQHKVSHKDEARKVLSIRELMGISKEMEPLLAEGSEFVDCQQDIGLGLMQFQSAITEYIAEHKITEEDFDKLVQVEALHALKKMPDCQSAYYLYLLVQDDK